MQIPLAQEFNDTAAAAHAAFRDKLRNLAVFFTPSSDTPVYVSPDIAYELTKDTAKIRQAVENIAEDMQRRKAIGLADKYFKLDGTAISMIAVDNKTDRGGASGRYTQEMALIFTLDHEIGHHILRNGYPSEVSRNCAESAADAYAMLRHIQRFGKSAGYAEGLAESRASFIVLEDDPEHYTTDAVQMAIRRAEEMGDDIFGLSLQETAALAEEIADACRIDDLTLSMINGAFWPVHQLYNEGAYRETLCREVVSVMREHQGDPDIFKAGKQYLSQPELKSFITGKARRDPYWQSALDFMNNDELRIADKGEFDYEALLNVNDAFRSVHAFYSQRNVLSEKAYNINLCRMVVSVMRAHLDDPDIFKAGKQFLSQPERKLFIGAAAQEGDPFWRDAFSFMKNYQPKPPAKPKRRGILRRLGLKR